VRIYRILELFFDGKTHGCWTAGGADVRRASARGRRCSPAVIGEDEDDTASPMVGTTEHE
jgi:hypothetical protein